MNKKAIKTCIIICWCLLATCMIFKLCGSKIFEVAVTNQRFIDICNWLSSEGIYVTYIVGGTLSIISNTFIILSSGLTPKPSWKQLLVIESVNIPVWFIKFFFPKIGFAVECVMFIVLPAILSKKWWTGFLGLALNVLFQVASLYIRGKELAIFADNVIFTIIFAIDYYIMIALYYMYMCLIKTKKEVVE